MYPCSVGIVSHKDLAHGGLSLSGKDYMKSSLIGGPSGEIFLAQGGALWGGCILAQWGLFPIRTSLIGEYRSLGRIT